MDLIRDLPINDSNLLIENWVNRVNLPILDSKWQKCLYSKVFKHMSIPAIINIFYATLIKVTKNHKISSPSF